jgi:hypothetical protein
MNSIRYIYLGFTLRLNHVSHFLGGTWLRVLENRVLRKIWGQREREREREMLKQERYKIG